MWKNISNNANFRLSDNMVTVTFDAFVTVLLPNYTSTNIYTFYTIYFLLDSFLESGKQINSHWKPSLRAEKLQKWNT